MICTNCNTLNGADSVFCVNCGNAVTGGTASSMPTVAYPNPTPPALPRMPVDSTETAVVNFGAQPHSVPHYSQGIPYPGEIRRRKTSPLIWVGGGLIAVLAIVAAGIVFIGPRMTSVEVLPDHLGMFVQSDARDRVDEIRKQDFTNAADAKMAFMKDDGLPSTSTSPNLVLYADSRDLNVNDLKLIQIDSLKDDGTMKTLDFQVQPVEGKPEMKRLRVPDTMANGKYAFALLQDYFNEGRHRFWAFQVRTSSKGDNGTALKDSSFPIKPKVAVAQRAPSLPPASPTAQQASPSAPLNTGMRTIIGNSVRVRVGPSSSAAFHPSFRFNRGAQVNVIGYTGYECPPRGNGCGPWAQIAGGYYVHSSLLR